ncbi:TIGR02302 family protein [Mesorhizobium sp. BAC0120]|uniref:TIGR02302 family protein n=1 Tax=Mesorhizobium sp. BAC0120 TaxID=3090670 RepID=UPI00298C871C|nr:TIGR02302 family protein [Mesorhizobium sp. BAC0120]MDW6026105.1 TIGR02302 family protein [Mesorhizobium sp. BAC0120]
MTEAKSVSDTNAHTGRLVRTRIATKIAVILERLWPLVLPLLLVIALFLSLSWLGLFRLLPDLVRLGLAAVFGLAALAALYMLRFFRMPTSAEIDRRIEAANRLEHNPLSAQSDRPGGSRSAFADALWREHQKRMAERLAGVSGDLPLTRVPERDPWALRAAVALLFIVAFGFSFSPFGGSPRDAFRARVGMDSIPPRIDAWVTPPAYTGKAPIFLTSNANAKNANANAGSTVTVPAGSEVALRVTGGSGDETLSYTDASGNMREIAANTQIERAAGQAVTATTGSQAARQFAGKLTTDGTLTLQSGGSDMESWTFTVIPDRPPTIKFVGEPKQALNGTLELNYEIDDDYGASSATTEFELAQPPAKDAYPLYKAPEMQLALPRRGAKNNVAKTTRDLTEHVWAGAPVRITLRAVDAAGQEAKSATKTIILPERPFSNPLARAVVEQRRLLALDTHQKRRVLDLMEAITLRPEDTFDNMSHYLALISAHTRLKLAGNDDAMRDVVSYLWQIALGIEDGDLSAAEKRLRQAQQALKDALQRGASDQEIDKLMKELRQAMNDFLREFAERAQKNPNLANQMQPGQELRQSDLERMMDQIENLAKSGNKDQAQQLLSQLEEMMNNLQAGRGQQKGGNGQQGEMNQQMNKLGEIMRRQQEMMNETFRMDQMERGQQGQNGQDQRGQNGDQQFGQQNQEGQPGDQGQEGRGQNRQGMSPQDFADAMKQLQQGQGDLRGQLEQLQKDLRGLGIQPGQGFGEAGDAMGQAETALGDNRGQDAVGQQGRALEALRKGAQDMMQQMQQAMQGDQGGNGRGQRQQGADRDPLGRPRATNGPDDGTGTKVPDEIDVQRARQILDAIRQRLGNTLSPQIERDYLERLLEMK